MTGPASAPYVALALQALLDAAKLAHAAMPPSPSVRELYDRMVVRMGLPRRAGTTTAALVYGDGILDGRYLYVSPEDGARAVPRDKHVAAAMSFTRPDSLVYALKRHPEVELVIFDHVIVPNPTALYEPLAVAATFDHPCLFLILGAH